VADGGHGGFLSVEGLRMVFNSLIRHPKLLLLCESYAPNRTGRSFPRRSSPWQHCSSNAAAAGAASAGTARAVIREILHPSPGARKFDLS
jgi:hypothetical protein